MPFVFAIFAAVAVLMGYVAFKPDCPGGALVADERACVAAFDADFCARAMGEADALARRSGPHVPTQSQCLEQWPVCIERADVAAWTPRPSAFCLAREGATARIEPRYSKR